MNNIVPEIKRLIGKNNPLALELIYKFAGRELYMYLLGITGAQPDAEDLLSDLFVRIAERKESLLKADNLKAYLYRMAANMAYDRIKRRKKHEAMLNDYSLILEAKNEEALSKEEITELHSILNCLPAEQKEVVILKNFMEKTFNEIAEITNVSINTAISRHRYALKKLKDILENKQ